MDSKTKSFTLSLLNSEANRLRSSIMESIDCGAPMGVIQDKIERYRSAKHARDDFTEWVDEEEDENG